MARPTDAAVKARLNYEESVRRGAEALADFNRALEAGRKRNARLRFTNRWARFWQFWYRFMDWRKRG